MHPAVIDTLAVPARNRPDAAEVLIRLEHSRERVAGMLRPEVGGQPRPAGSVAVELASMGRCKRVTRSWCDPRSTRSLYDRLLTFATQLRNRSTERRLLSLGGGKSTQPPR